MRPQLPPKRPGQNGLFHQVDLAQSIFGGFSDVPFLRKKIIKDADNFLLFGEGGDRDNKSTSFFCIYIGLVDTITFYIIAVFFSLMRIHHIV